jgi:hypothetical protein
LFAVADAMHAEAVALSNAVKVADHFGVGLVVFETDCCNLQRAMISSAYDLSPIGVIITDINFIQASVVFSPLFCNKPAHELAALGIGVVHGDHVLWTTSYPNSVSRLVTGDSAVS